MFNFIRARQVVAIASILATSTMSFGQNGPQPTLFPTHFGAKYLSNAMTFDGGDGGLKSDVALDLTQPSFSLNLGDMINKKGDSVFPSDVLRGNIKLGFNNTLAELTQGLASNVNGEIDLTYSRIYRSAATIKWFVRDSVRYRQEAELLGNIVRLYGNDSISIANRDSIHRMVSLVPLLRGMVIDTASISERDSLYDAAALRLPWNTLKYQWTSFTVHARFGQESLVEEDLDVNSGLGYVVGLRVSHNFVHIINNRRRHGEFAWGGNKFIKPYLMIGLTNRSITALNDFIVSQADSTVEVYGLDRGQVGTTRGLLEMGMNLQFQGIYNKVSFALLAKYRMTFAEEMDAVGVVEVTPGFALSISSLLGKGTVGNRENLFIGLRFSKAVAGTDEERSFYDVAPVIRYEIPLVFNK